MVTGPVSELFDFHFEFAEAMNEIRPHPLDIAHHFHAHAALVDFLEQNPELEFGQTRTDTAMNAVAEGDMAPCVLARDVQLVGIVEHFLVAVGGG